MLHNKIGDLTIIATLMQALRRDWCGVSNHGTYGPAVRPDHTEHIVVEPIRYRASFLGFEADGDSREAAYEALYSLLRQRILAEEVLMNADVKVAK